MSVPGRWRRIAGERIELLFQLAEEEVGEHPERARRYMELARRLGEKYRVRPRKELRRKYCRECFSYLKEGVTLTVRIDSEEEVIEHICDHCGDRKRYPMEADE